MKTNTIKLVGAVLIVIAFLGLFLFYLRSALGDIWVMEDSWTEKLTEESELKDYLEFYPADENSISSKKGTFIINNKTDQVMLTGTEGSYRPQKKVLGEWCDDKLTWDVPGGCIEVPPGENSFTINWGTDYTGYGELSPGTYRVIKSCSLFINKVKYGPDEYLDLVFAYEFKIS